MNPTNQIEYPNNKPTNEDIFDKLIKKIRSLQLMLDKHKLVWQYFLYASLMIVLGIIAWTANK